MAGTSRPSERIPKIERSVEWSRFEKRLMASAYECLLPLVRQSLSSNSLTSDSKMPAKVPSAQRGYATGA